MKELLDRKAEEIRTEKHKPGERLVTFFAVDLNREDLDYLGKAAGIGIESTAPVPGSTHGIEIKGHYLN